MIAIIIIAIAGASNDGAGAGVIALVIAVLVGLAARAFVLQNPPVATPPSRSTVGLIVEYPQLGHCSMARSTSPDQQRGLYSCVICLIILMLWM
jgi:hypothetical protein